MRVWVDLTNSPHVLVMRPLIEAMRAVGHEVEVTARDFAQTLELCERFGIEHTPIGRHRGERLIPKFAGLLARSAALRRWARGRGFDIAMGHGSNDVSVAAALLRIPAATAFDYEYAATQHHVNCRLCRTVVVPEAIPPERLCRYGATPRKLRRYAGLKEEYYLADFEPDEAVLDGLGLERSRRSWWCERRRRRRSTTASRIRSSGGCWSGCEGARPRPSCSRGRATSALSSWGWGSLSCRTGPSTHSAWLRARTWSSRPEAP